MALLRVLVMVSDQAATSKLDVVLFFTLNREDFSFVIHLDRLPSNHVRAEDGRRRRGQGRVAARVASEPLTPSSTPVPSWSGGRS